MIIEPNRNQNEMSFMPQNMKMASKTKVDGDRYILARFSLVYGAIIEDSSNSLGELLSNIPNFLWEEDDENLSVCEVSEWRENKNDPSDFLPVKLKTLFTIVYHNSPSDED